MNENSTISEAMKQHQLSVTPNFDWWAKRDVTFNNTWSSWQTSRSLESILFGQIPLDSVTETGTTYGREDTKLSGMPQCFKQKGYETVFTIGCTIKYDQWDRFLPSHGFDTVLGEPEIRALAEKELGISPSDWYNFRLDYGWGIHDDSSFAVQAT